MVHQRKPVDRMIIVTDDLGDDQHENSRDHSGVLYFLLDFLLNRSAWGFCTVKVLTVDTVQGSVKVSIDRTERNQMDTRITHLLNGKECTNREL